MYLKQTFCNYLLAFTVMAVPLTMSSQSYDRGGRLEQRHHDSRYDQHHRSSRERSYHYHQDRYRDDRAYYRNRRNNDCRRDDRYRRSRYSGHRHRGGLFDIIIRI